jgi:hypothetical protein
MKERKVIIYEQAHEYLSTCVRFILLREGYFLSDTLQEVEKMDSYSLEIPRQMGKGMVLSPEILGEEEGREWYSLQRS